MSKYSLSYQEDHNIDWYVKFNGLNLHLASGGTSIPDVINKEQNRSIQKYVALKSEEFLVQQRYKVNDSYVDDLLSVSSQQFNILEHNCYDINNAQENASLGFYSYCYWATDKWGGVLYRLVSYPSVEMVDDPLAELDIPKLDNCIGIDGVAMKDCKKHCFEYIRIW